MARNRSHSRRDLPPNLYVRNNGYYCYRDPRTGKEYGLGKIKRDAVNQAIEANIQLMDCPSNRLVDRISFDTSMLFHDWLDHYSKVINSRGLKPKTLKEYNGKIRILRTIIDNVPIESITTKDIASIISSYSAEGKTTTAKLIRITLLDIFREAIADGHITHNPVEATRNPRSEIKRSRLSLSEYKEIYRCSLGLQPWIPLSIELALMTGQRVSDISKIKWKDIRDGMLWIEQKKTGNKLVIDLSLTLDAIGVSLKDTVERCRVLFGRFDNIICSQTGTQLTTTTMARGFAKARELSGIKWEKEPPSFHELRSLSARLYTEEKGTEFAQRLLGHKSAVMTAKYQDNRGSEWVKVAT
ncbi:tyrosine-type recombinase/integrase [Hafnia alvei]|uniref:tyrosine-type recombinase/integrase n=1 Tax=Hafnia alvei TaxID=569 RepID=UPI001411D2DB|nr:tyrosine-type recombinase/integrase [Hafnia alvei]QIP56871.1 tyrosine-type recombinase/integrase [Hafnia alvei]